mgnify:CR=1 FL=1
MTAIDQNKWTVTEEDGIKVIKVIDLNDLKETLTPEYLNGKAKSDDQIKFEHLEDADEDGIYGWTEFQWLKYIEYGGVMFTFYPDKKGGDVEADDEFIYIEPNPEMIDILDQVTNDFYQFYAADLAD